MGRKSLIEILQHLKYRREKRVIQNVCKEFVEPPLFLMQCNLPFL